MNVLRRYAGMVDDRFAEPRRISVGCGAGFRLIGTDGTRRQGQSLMQHHSIENKCHVNSRCRELSWVESRLSAFGQIGEEADIIFHSFLVCAGPTKDYRHPFDSPGLSW